MACSARQLGYLCVSKPGIHTYKHRSRFFLSSFALPALLVRNICLPHFKHSKKQTDEY